MSRIRSVPLLPDVEFNADETRMSMPCRDGFACYTGERNEDIKWHGSLVGIVADKVAAKRFVQGATVEFRRKAG